MTRAVAVQEEIERAFREVYGQAVATLVRGDIPYATGSVIHVDGGLAVPRL